MPAVWTPRHSGHAPDGGYWLGVLQPGDEEPPRGEILRVALEGAGADVHLATAHGEEPVLRVHDPEFLDWFSRAWPEWEAAGLVEADRAAAGRALRLRAAATDLGPADPGTGRGLGPQRPLRAWTR